MTERGLPIVDGAPACPFVAFADDRDERASSPDHRHRCYAEREPAPRALAHQEAYCLASAFPICPTFQDWARREAARTRPDEVPGAGYVAGGTYLPPTAPPVQRNPPRDWAAPPPWQGGGPGSGNTSTADGYEDDEVRAIPRGGGLAGSFADRVASGDEVSAPEPEMPVPPPIPTSQPVAAAPATSAGGGRRASAPEWEQPRRMEDFPAIRSRRLAELSISPVLLAFVALLLAAAVLFALPGLLGFGGPGGGATPTPRSSGPVATEAPSLGPTTVPQPTATVYLVQPGDTMSKIAKQFGIPLQDLIDANAENIPNPDQLQIGDQVIIPVVTPTGIPGEVPAAS